LQLIQNIERQKLPSEKGKGFVGSAIIHIVLLALLISVSFSVPPPPETGEGILVNFGTDDTGLGPIEPSPPAGKTETSPTSPTIKEKTSPPQLSSNAKKTADEPLISQNTEDAPEVKKVNPEDETTNLKKIEADKKKKEELETERIRKKQEEDERKRIEAEEKRQSDIMNRTKNALANSKNSGTSSTSEGIAGGTGNQGDPRGSVDSKVRGEGGGLGTSGTGTGDKGPSYELKGRNNQKLPEPKYDYQDEGRVVVEVSVDRSGKVIQAVPGVKGSTTLNEYLLKVARDAAMEASFDAKPDAPLFQKGTITYNFFLK
jgi:colicin import membrane protein